MFAKKYNQPKLWGKICDDSKVEDQIITKRTSYLQWQHQAVGLLHFTWDWASVVKLGGVTDSSKY